MTSESPEKVARDFAPERFDRKHIIVRFALRQPASVPHFARTAFRLILCVGVGLHIATPLEGQAPSQTPGPWKTLGVGNFVFHYPQALEGWTFDVARRIEDVEGRVAALVGHHPPQRIQVIVDDPLATSKGMAGPGPIIYLWPTPPGPRSMIGETRGWGEILAVHEYAHVAHLTRPSRNPVLSWAMRHAPIPLAPLFIGTPSWVLEGYATWVEGVLTGAGRPNGVARPALFRTWALEGQLPTYPALNGGGDGFLAGAYPYLVGSAFLAWLLEREGRGADALQDLWARMTAVETRSFDTAFIGVFGEPAPDLYGRFKVDLMARAIQARSAVEETGGFHEGARFQIHSGGMGEPALSPDGAYIAYTRPGASGRSELVVVRSSPDTISSEERARQARIEARDPEDIAAVERRPREQEAVATLAPWGGIPFRLPRWMPDGERLVVIRDVEIGNGRLRPEAFVWNRASGTLRSLTRDAGIRELDPAPDGSWGAGIRCDAGRCDLVRVDVQSGTVTTLAEGTFDAPFSRPRVSPDGTLIVVEQPEAGLWQLVAFGPDGSRQQRIGPLDGASRFDAAFWPGGRDLVVVSTAGGLLNLERVGVDPGASASVVTLTRTLGSTMAPAAAPDGSVFYLTFTSRGMDLLRLPAGTGPGGSPDGVSPIELPDGLFPMAASGRFEAPPFETVPLPSPRAYGLGTLNRMYLPMGIWTSSGWELGGVLQQIDPIGRLTVQLRGSSGSEGRWQDGALSGHLRLGGPSVVFTSFLATPSQSPIASRSHGTLLALTLPALDLERAGFAGAGRVDVEVGGARQARDGVNRTSAWIQGAWVSDQRLSTDADRFFRSGVTSRVVAGTTEGDRWSQ